MSFKQVEKLLLYNKFLKSKLDFKKYSYFLKKRSNGFSLYNHKKIYYQLQLLVFILKKTHLAGVTILFIGLSYEDKYPNYIYFNKFLENLVISRGHIYASPESNFKSVLYNRWSLYKRYSHPSNFFLRLQNEKEFPSILLSFSKKTNNVIFKEISKYGIPTIYFLEGASNLNFKDFPITGIYSNKMLDFYLDILKFCLK